jgi:hypothetical protein
MGDRKYPSIFELALKAGKWSVIAGSSAAIIGATGCLEPENNGENDLNAIDVISCDGCDRDVPDIWMGVTDVTPPDLGQPDVQVVPDVAYPELGGVAPYDPGGNPEDVIVPDVIDSDPGLMGDWAGDVYPPADVIAVEDVVATDVVDSEVTDVVNTGDFLAGGIPMEDI